MTTPVIDQSQPVRVEVERPADAIQAFNEIYTEAAGDHTQIPWAHGKPNPTLVRWLDEVGSCIIRPGARVVVVGSGLGDDVAFLAERGYEVVGFDAASAAVESAKQRHPELSRTFMEADLFDLPGRLLGRHDLVVEIHTIQALPMDCRPEVAAAITSLLNHHGILFLSSRTRPDDVPPEAAEGPPWEPTPDEMRTLMADAGLEAASDAGGFEVYHDDNDPPVRRIRAAFRRR